MKMEMSRADVSMAASRGAGVRGGRCSVRRDKLTAKCGQMLVAVKKLRG